MSRSIVLRSFAELAEVLNMDELPEEPSAEPAADGSVAVVEATIPDLHSLLAELEEANATLTAIARRDQEAREGALRDLERYDALVARQREAEQAGARARQIQTSAEAMIAAAFADEARAAATRTASLAAGAEVAATTLAERCRHDAEHMASQLDMERLLEVRRKEKEAEKAKAAEAELARRLSGALAGASEALEAGRFEEAKRLLVPVSSEFPDNPQVVSLKNIIARRELEVKTSTAEDAIWTARRELRRDPAAAVARLESLKVDGLPEVTARHLFGEWARACVRLCRDRGIPEPLRYAPDPGRGAIIAREGLNGGYTVVSALGMGANWQPGSTVSERQVRRARPLR